MTKSRLSAIAVLVLCAAQGAMGQAGPQGAEKQDAEKLNAALKKLDAFIAETMAKTKVPGLAVAVVYGDKTVFAQGYGVRRLGDPAGVNADTVFEIASVSKPLASTVVASLVGTGDVSWDDRIAKLDPDFALSEGFPQGGFSIRAADQQAFIDQYILQIQGGRMKRISKVAGATTVYPSKDLVQR